METYDLDDYVDAIEDYLFLEAGLSLQCPRFHGGIFYWNVVRVSLVREYLMINSAFHMGNLSSLSIDIIQLK